MRHAALAAGAVPVNQVFRAYHCSAEEIDVPAPSAARAGVDRKCVPSRKHGRQAQRPCDGNVTALHDVHSRWIQETQPVGNEKVNGGLEGVNCLNPLQRIMSPLQLFMSPATEGIAQAADGAASAASDGPGVLATLEDPAERANEYASRSKSQATINAYAAGWRDFLQFCQRRGAVPLPASDDTVAGYLAELADTGLKAATIARRLVVISQAHRAADLPSPTTSSLVRRTHAGIRRSIGTAQVAKAPAVVSDLKRMLDTLPGTRVGLRDRALLLVGFGGLLLLATLALVAGVVVPSRRFSPVLRRSVDVAEAVLIAAVLPLALGVLHLYTTFYHTFRAP